MPEQDSATLLPGSEPAGGSSIDEQSVLPETTTTRTRLSWSQIWERLLRLGLGEIAMRIGTGMTSIILVLIVVWVMSNFYLKGSLTDPSDAAIAAPLPTATDSVKQPPLDLSVIIPGTQGIYRLAQMHTTFPTKPRNNIVEYEVQAGDTVIGIAEKFNLKPQTIMWGNYYTMGDNPHNLYPGQILNILPIDGVYHRWSAGEGLNGVSEYYGVKPEDIINWSGNGLTLESVGDFAAPRIEPGTMLVVPGGTREFIDLSAPRISRANPSVAKIFGPGSCGQVMDGPIGTGTFVWPSVEHWLSGYDYSPETNHWGIDVAGSMGNAIYAADTGVVVYAGWNDWGYGNVVVVDHGNGWQTLYAHLSSYTVECGSYVYQGDMIAAMGSTGKSSGPHLHFEMRSDEYGKANPWNFMQ